jgi:hypothetical protein
MRIYSGGDDPFRDKIREMLLDSSASSGRGFFKSRVFAEVQNYSRELQEVDFDSDFFFRLLELIVDCQSLSIPDNSFRIIVAGLLCEFKDSKGCPEDEVRQMSGMDTESFDQAKESLKDRQCIVSALNREKTGRKGSIMAGKRNFSRVEQTVSQ